MKDLPYFLLLIKKDAVLWTIITTNSFADINLEATVHGFWSNQCLELRDYALNKDEHFKNIRIINDESYITIDFYTDSDKYMKNTEYYFGEPVKDLNSLSSNNIKENSSQKQLGEFDMGLEITTDVDIVNYGSEYGSVIGIKVYKNREN